MKLSKSVIKKIQMAKLLYDLGCDCFRVSENPEKIGAGLILLQDSVELFLIAICEHLDISLGDYIKFPEYFKQIEGEEKEEVPLKKQILTLNRQRVNIKHHGILPHIDDCKDFPNTVKIFFQELSNRYLKADFDTITLVDLLDEGEVKNLLKQAEMSLKNKKYKECQINCRKALYITFEKQFDIRIFEKGEYDFLAAKVILSSAPFYTENKEYIEKHVENPRDYISIDPNVLEKDLLRYGIIPIDFWNVLRLTPPMYYYEEDNKWIIKDEFNDTIYNEENAEYCFRKTIEILLLKQRYSRQTKGENIYWKILVTKSKAIKIYEKATFQGKIVLELEGPVEFFSSFRVEGFDGKIYYKIMYKGEGEPEDIFDGYVCENDIEEIKDTRNNLW